MKKRSYRQNCGLARAADLIGERWTFLIIRELLLRPRRFGEILANLPGMGTNLLARRLQELQAEGLLKKQGGSSDRMSPYVLTATGAALEPVILAMVRWSITTRGLAQETGHYHHPDWDLIALKSVFAGRPTDGSPLTVQFDSATWQAWVTVSDRGYDCGLGAAPAAPDAVFAGDITALAAAAQRGTLADHPARAALTGFLLAFETPAADPS